MRRPLWAITAVFVLLNRAVFIFAGSVVLPDPSEFDLSAIPPSATEMLREERKKYESQSIQSIKKIVEDAVAKKNGKRKNDTVKNVKKSEGSPTKKALKTALNKLMQ